jgi:hypothetical protein
MPLVRVTKHRAFWVAFIVLLAMTAVISLRSPIKPGQDFHYHVFVAAVNAFPSDEPVSMLYRTISPLDANSLIYYVAWPFEKLTDPLHAFAIVTLLLYYAGFPASCAYALLRAGRSPWGSLLAFPIVYGISSHTGGYYPFMCAIAFVPLALAEYSRLLDTDGTRNQLIRCAIIMALTFLCHAHVFAWLAFVLGVHTVMVMVWRARIVAPAGLGLGTIAPALALMAGWYWKITKGSATATHDLPVAQLPEPNLHDKLLRFVDSTVVTFDLNEVSYGVALAVLVFALLLVRRVRERGRREPPHLFETFLMLTIVSCVLLPFWYDYQTVALRQFDLALATGCLVLFPKAPKLLSAGGAAVFALFAFCFMRLALLGRQMTILDTADFKGFTSAASQCRGLVPNGKLGRLAHAVNVTQSTAFRSVAMQQAHASFGAMCRLEVPLYDTSERGHNTTPLRYKDKIDAPVTIIGTVSWYANANLWRDYDYVLVRGWHPSPQERALAREKANMLIEEGEYQLWHRKD